MKELTAEHCGRFLVAIAGVGAGPGRQLTSMMSAPRGLCRLRGVAHRLRSWTQQQIAEALKVPRQTVTRWLANMSKPITSKVGNHGNNAHLSTYNNAHNSIPLYACRYDYGLSVPNIMRQLALRRPTIYRYLSHNSSTSLSHNSTKITHLEGDCLELLPSLLDSGGLCSIKFPRRIHVYCLEKEATT